MVSKNRPAKMFVLGASRGVAILAAWILYHAGHVLLASVATSIATYLLLDPVLDLIGERFGLERRAALFALAVIAGAFLLLAEAYGW